MKDHQTLSWLQDDAASLHDCHSTHLMFMLCLENRLKASLHISVLYGHWGASLQRRLHHWLTPRPRQPMSAAEAHSHLTLSFPCSNSLLLVFLSFSCLVRLQGGGEPEQRSVGPSRTTTVSPSRTQPHKASAQSHHLVLHAVTTVSARTGGGKEATIKT